MMQNGGKDTARRSPKRQQGQSVCVVEASPYAPVLEAGSKSRHVSSVLQATICSGGTWIKQTENDIDYWLMDPYTAH